MTPALSVGAVWRLWPVSGPTRLSSARGLWLPWSSGRPVACTQSMEGVTGSSEMTKMAPGAATAQVESLAVPKRVAPPPEREQSLHTVWTQAPGSRLPASPGARATSFFSPAGTSPSCCLSSFSQPDGVAMMPSSPSETGERHSGRSLDGAGAGGVWGWAGPGGPGGVCLRF